MCVSLVTIHRPQVCYSFLCNAATPPHPAPLVLWRESLHSAPSLCLFVTFNVCVCVCVCVCVFVWVFLGKAHNKKVH